jgi:hypothetical protein
MKNNVRKPLMTRKKVRNLEIEAGLPLVRGAATTTFTANSLPDKRRPI